MRCTASPCNARNKHQQRCRIAVQSKVLVKLVETALQKSSADCVDGFCTATGNSRNKSHGMFFANADIYETGAEILPSHGVHGKHGRRCRRHRHHAFVGNYFFRQITVGDFTVIFAAVCFEESPRLQRKGASCVKQFSVLLGRRKPLALLRVNMHHNGFCHLLRPFQRLYHLQNVIALFHVHVLQSQRRKHIVFAFAVGGTQFCKISDVSAVIFRNGHFVVVHHNYKRRCLLGNVVESLVRFASRKGTVAYHGNHAVCLPQQISRFGKTAGKGKGCGCVPHREKVVNAFLGVGETVDVIVAFGEKKSVFSARQHLVHVALMGNVKHDFVHGRIENIVQRHGEFHHSQIGTYVSAVIAEFGEQHIAHFVAHRRQIAHCNFFQIFWGIYFFKIHLILLLHSTVYYIIT